jgi:hypothetical protein
LQYRRAGGAVSDIATREGAEAVGYVAAFHLAQAVPGQVRGQVAAHSAGYAYDYFTQSPASSSSSYQQNGGAGGTGKPVTVEPTYERKMSGPTQSYKARICPPGYTSRKVRGKWICVLKGHPTPGWS